MNGDTASLGYRYIIRQPGVRSGAAIIAGTRIGVHDVIGLLQNGETLDTLVSQCFPPSAMPRPTNAWPTTKTIAAKLTCLWLAKCRSKTPDMHLTRLLLTVTNTLREVRVPLAENACLRSKRGEELWDAEASWLKELHREFLHARAQETARTPGL